VKASGRRSPFRARCCWLAASVLALTEAARAAPASDDATLAEALFREGKALADAGRHAEACPKLRESHRLDAGGGTVLALALCYEAEGRWASAWAAFNEVIAFAQRDGRADRESRAKERLAALEPRLSRLTIRVADPPDGLEVLRDGSLLAAAAWGSTIPVDPGRHEIQARAPGYRPWQAVLEVAAEGRPYEVEIPALAPVAVSAPAPSSLPPVTAAGSAPSDAPIDATSGTDVGPPPRLIAGYSLLGAGMIGLGIGTWFGLRAISDSEAADERCPQPECSDPEGVRLAEDGRRSALVSTVAFAAGGVLAASGVYLLVTHEGSRSSAMVGMKLSPIGRAGFGAALGARF
jgi:hypothetical protein